MTMKSLYIYLIVFACFTVVSCSTNTNNKPKEPIVQSINLGKLDVKRGIGGDKDFVELKRLLEVDSIDVVELYWMQNGGVSDKPMDCTLRYGKNDSSFVITAKIGNEEHTIREKFSKEQILKIINTPNADWNHFDLADSDNATTEPLEKYISVVKVEIEPMHMCDAICFYFKSSTPKNVTKLKLQVASLGWEDDGYVTIEDYETDIELDKPLNDQSNIIYYSEPCQFDNTLIEPPNKIEVTVLSAE